MTRSNTGMVVAGVAVVGVVLLLAVAGSGSKAKPGKKPSDTPVDTPKDDDQGVVPPPTDAPTALDLSKLTGVQVVDNRKKAPASYIMRTRAPSEITSVVLHQTGFDWKPDNALWPKVRAHFVVRRDGVVLCNFDPTARMRYGSNAANKFCITIEHEGNFPSDKGLCWEVEKYGCDDLQARPAQVAAARALIAALRKLYPSITHVFAHRQWDKDKQNCCGPDVWRLVGEWAKATLGLKDGGEGWHYDTGLSIPTSWRT